MTEFEKVEREFQLRLRNAFAASGMTQKELAEKAGIAPQQLGAYLNGRHYPLIGTMSRICKALNVSMNWIVTGRGPVTEESK